MKTSLLAGIAISAFILASQASAADYIAPSETSFMPYVSVFAGASFPNDVNTTRYGTVDLSQGLSTGYLIGAAVGVDWGNVVRTEIEVSHNHWNGDALSTGGVPNTGFSSDVSATYLLGNVWLDWKNDSAFTPYIGGGLGVAFVNFDQTISGNHGYAGNDTVLAYQLGAGVNFALSQQLSLDVGYRYKGTANFDIHDGDGSPDFVNAHLGSHNVQVGLTYKF